jgi:putative two-component system response regulator
MIEVRLVHKKLQVLNEVLEQRVQERTADLKESYQETIFTITRAAEHRDEDTGSHLQRIAYGCREMSYLLKLDEVFIDRIFFASPLHDIGKIGTPDHVLLKEGTFTPEEWEIMKGHASMGFRILGKSKSPYLQMGAEIALNHHERWDGGGYPNGKVGKVIPLTARIMNICDIYDALRSKRPYKPAFDHQKTMEIMTCGDDRTEPEHFDPVILAMFEKYHEVFGEIFEAHTEEPAAVGAGISRVVEAPKWCAAVESARGRVLERKG